MAMKSLNLLPELQKLPSSESDQRKSFQDTVTDLRSMDRELYAAEAAAAVSFAMWGIFDTINVDDTLAEAHAAVFPNYEGSLHEHWQELLQQGEESSDEFINTFKGKVAELDFAEELEAQGYTNIEIPPDPTQHIRAISPAGQEELFQVETGLADHAGDIDIIVELPVRYAVSTEIRNRIAERNPELIDRMIDIGLDRAREEKIKATLSTIGTEGAEQNPEFIKLNQAYQMQYPGEYAQYSLAEKWQQISEGGNESMTGFISGLKGKYAEINTKDMLEEVHGFTNVNIAPNPTQGVFDITANAPDGEFLRIQVKTGSASYAPAVTQKMQDGQEVLFQVKTGDASYDSDVIQTMQNTPDLPIYMSDTNIYELNTEIYDKIAEQSPELIDQTPDIGANYELVNGINDGLETLSANQGFDLPDSVGEIVPYAAAIIMGARLIYNVIKTEKEFSTVDRTTKNKMQVVQALTTMSRFGISTVLSTAGGFGGAAAGSFVPGIGNLAGGVGGSLIGAGIGMYLNKHLQPDMLNLALDITGLTRDDLFYYKNKPHIDSVALSFRQNADMLIAAS